MQARYVRRKQLNQYLPASLLRAHLPRYQQLFIDTLTPARALTTSCVPRRNRATPWEETNWNEGSDTAESFLEDLDHLFSTTSESEAEPEATPQLVQIATSLNLGKIGNLKMCHITDIGSNKELHQSR
ncbi:hypothetical protein HW555_013655 [Spodoptera exigua]|uniref:Uncharacterized protein n=1 Tax=Spodoptera exigua TaxID=7107 RepID=A0A835G2Y4_SPOEX|nr:hypothetical protein HW555_013655 [Spodoptera exigua]